MAKRGDELREHILICAKDVFLEVGFERASMDEVATRAAASKRTLYTYFKNKDKLFLAVIDLVRGWFLHRIQNPEAYSKKPLDALSQFCGRYLEVLLYEGSVRMLRISMTQSERFPEQAAQVCDILFAEVERRIAAYLKNRLSLSDTRAAETSNEILARLLHPGLQHALFGLQPLARSLPADGDKLTIDLAPIRRVVAGVLQRLKELPSSSSKSL